jgi:hypothetical protein
MCLHMEFTLIHSIFRPNTYNNLNSFCQTRILLQFNLPLVHLWTKISLPCRVLMRHQSTSKKKRRSPTKRRKNPHCYKYLFPQSRSLVLHNQEVKYSFK